MPCPAWPRLVRRWTDLQGSTASALVCGLTAGHCADGPLLDSDGSEAGLGESDEGSDDDSEDLDGEPEPGAVGNGAADLLLGLDSDAEEALIPGGSSDEGGQGLGSSENSEEEDEAGNEDALHAFEKKARTLDRARWG